MSSILFPKPFLWGAATSAYQIEGAPAEDGKGPSIWDTFAHLPGKAHQGHTGDTAADHYHRMAEDVALMKALGINAYRFSIAWTRIFPQGRGALNQPGLDFYQRLVDLLLENDIQPIATLFHYDLPQALQDQGGWPARDTAYAFADYAAAVTARLGDRVSWWMTHNEPFVTAAAGHLTGEHAPGIRDIPSALAAAHHLLLSHGLAVQAMRAGSAQPLQIGIALNLNPVYPISDTEPNRLAASRYDGFLNRMTLEPLFRRKYPEDIYSLLGFLFPPVHDGDMDVIAQPIDFLGVNYYSRGIVEHNPNIPVLEFAEVHPPDSSYSQMWEIYPPGIYDLLTRIQREYAPVKIMISENGICVPDGLDVDGKVRDPRRIQYLQDHLVEVNRAIQAGVPVMGYLVWSLLDNFEWAYGYGMRFGLVYIDFETQRRVIKNSGTWYRQVIQDNGFQPQEYYREFLPSTAGE